MEVIYIEILGSLGASLTTFSFLPQTIKTVKTGDTRGISLGMYLEPVFKPIHFCFFVNFCSFFKKFFEVCPDTPAKFLKKVAKNFLKKSKANEYKDRF